MSASVLRTKSGTSQTETLGRVEDFLNDKLQTEADLKDIGALLKNVVDQQILLRGQLEEAESDLAQEQIHVQNQNAAVLSRAAAFQKQQDAIDRRVKDLTGSSFSDEAFDIFEKSMDKLQQLEIAQAYFDLLKQVHNLSTEAKSRVKKSPKAALGPYAQLQAILAVVRERQNTAEGAAPHLVDYVEKTVKSSWQQMRAILEDDFEKLLQKMKWPGKATQFEVYQGQWDEQVVKLLEFQTPQLESIFADSGNTSSSMPILLPLETMAKALEVRFKYHFDADRPTNRLDKPEYFLSHIFDLLSTYDPVLSIYLQPLLTRISSETGLERPQLSNSTSAFISSLLPIIRRKIRRYLPQVADQPQLLSHFVHELISFDDTLRNEWSFTGPHADESWNGLAWEVLVEADWFSKWLAVERDFALARYQDIIDSPDSGEIDFDSVDIDTTKPTKGALRVNDLLETVTDRYRPLSSLSQKLRFLMDIQIAIFDKFHSRLNSALEAYLAATSSVVRAVQGISKEEQASVTGLAGLERLCRVYGSSEYLEQAMTDWSNDVFFLELWDDLTTRASSNTSTKRLSANLGTSSSAPIAALAATASADPSSSSGLLFDETSSAYRTLRLRTEELIIELIAGNTREALRPYARLNHWSTLSAPPSSITSELSTPLSTLSSSLTFLTRVLSPPSLRRVTRQVCLALQTYLWEYVLQRNRFSGAGAAQFALDVREGFWQVVDDALGNEGVGRKGMARLAEGLRLLTLDEEGEGEEGLQSVGAKLFRSNEAARAELGRLGIVLLGEAEARGVMERRVELSG